MNRMGVAALFAAGWLLGGCADTSGHEAAPAPTTEGVSVSFIPWYVQTLRDLSAPRLGEGMTWRKENRQDSCMKGPSVGELLMPCDIGGR